MGMSEKEISKFLASKALIDAKLVRELEVAPKKTIPYRYPCSLPGHSKKQCSGKQISMKQSKKTDKAKRIRKFIEPKIETIEQELQKIMSNLRGSKRHLRNISEDLVPHVRRSKGLIEIQRKLCDRLFELEVARTSGLQNSPLTLHNIQNPRKLSTKLPLRAEDLERFERILAGRDELEKLDDRFTDYLIYLEQIKKRRLELHRQKDHVDYSGFKYVGPDGALHKKPSKDPKRDNRFYEKVIKTRISCPRTASLKNRNNLKRIRHAELMVKKSRTNQHVPYAAKRTPIETERVALETTSPRLERARRHVLDLQNRYHSAQRHVNQLTREFQLRHNKPEYEERCHEIRKDLCKKIDDTVWKQKDYHRENSKLQKMLQRRTFTSIEKAYATDVIKSTVADISTSYDQGLPPRPTSGKLSTKDKIKQLQMMLHDLEDEVHSTNDTHDFQWDDDEQSNDEKKSGEKKSETVTLTSAQAKLAKELIKLANTYKVPELTFTDKARARRTAYQTWFTKLRTILAMFAETSQLIQGENVIPFTNADCIGNKAIFLLIGSRVDAYFQRAIRKYEGKGDQALAFIKNQCASTTADDTHHFHHLFTSLRIKENESATNFFRRFTFARTEAEGVGNTYQEASLVNFALAGLATSHNPRYDTAVQLYNLERDGGKTYTLEEIEKKFFAIDEKMSREHASARIAQGNMATSQRGDQRERTHRGIRNRRRNGHRKPESANAASDLSTRFANATCFVCGKKGHIAPQCPDKKKDNKSSKNPGKQAEGHVAVGTSNSPSPELVCLARNVPNPYVRPPRSGPAPVISLDLHAREMLNTGIYVSLAIRANESMFSWERERAFERGHLPALYEGDLEPMEDGDPLWVLLHNRPLNDLEPRAARIVYPANRTRPIFVEGIIPVLKRGFNVTPNRFPRCFRFWHSLVAGYIARRLENVEQGLNLPVTVGVKNRTIVVTFYPIGSHRPSLTSMGDMQYITHPTDSDEEFERALAAISQTARRHPAHDPASSRPGRSGRGTKLRRGSGRWPHYQMYDDRKNKNKDVGRQRRKFRGNTDGRPVRTWVK